MQRWPTTRPRRSSARSATCAARSWPPAPESSPSPSAVRPRAGRRLGLHHGRRRQRLLDRARGARRRHAGLRRARAGDRADRRRAASAGPTSRRPTSRCRHRRTACASSPHSPPPSPDSPKTAMRSRERSPRRPRRELALSVTTSLRRVALPGDERFAVCAMGGVFRSRLLHDAFAAALPESLEGAAVSLVPPRGEGIDGVIALADLPAEHPLASAVHSTRAPR